MGTRHPDRDMMSNLTSLEAYVKMIEKALSNDKTKVRKLLEMKEKVESFYFNFNQTYHLYKAGLISNEKITEAQFNAKDTDTGEDSYKCTSLNYIWTNYHFATKLVVLLCYSLDQCCYLAAIFYCYQTFFHAKNVTDWQCGLVLDVGYK